MAKHTWVHRLQHVNPEARTGVCSECGFVELKRRSPRRPDGPVRWSCKPGEKAGRGTRGPRTTFDGLAYLDRIVSSDITPDDSGCIIWPGVTLQGYAVVSKGGAVRVTHLVLEALVGPKPSPTHVAAHAPHDVCGNRACVNVDHLRWATVRENVADKVRDGTSNRGEGNGNAKLTEQDVREIRDLYSSGVWTTAAIGEQYGVSASNVGMIGRGQAWVHVDETPG